MFKSLKQRAKFLELLEQGKITQETFDNWDKNTEKKKLLLKFVKSNTNLTIRERRPRRLAK